MKPSALLLTCSASRCAGSVTMSRKSIAQLIGKARTPNASGAMHVCHAGWCKLHQPAVHCRLCSLFSVGRCACFLMSCGWQTAPGSLECSICVARAAGVCACVMVSSCLIVCYTLFPSKESVASVHGMTLQELTLLLLLPWVVFFGTDSVGWEA